MANAVRNAASAASAVKQVAKASSKASAPAPQSPAPAPAATPLAVARANVAAKAASGVGVTMHTSGAAIKGLAAELVVARPQRKMLRAIASIKGHPGKAACVKRFHLYTVGMTLLHAKVTAGLIPSDITYYAELGYLTLRDPTDQEYAAAVAAWELARAPAPAAAVAA